MNQKWDVIVVGGGIVGLSAALAIHAQNYKVAIVDAGTSKINTSNKDPRVYAINRASEDLLQSLKVWERLDKNRLSPYQNMYVWDASSGADIHFDARMIAESQLGHIIEESVLKQALYHAIQDAGIPLFSTCSVQKIENKEKSIAVHCQNQHWDAQLLMIADGGNSYCRKLLNVPVTTWPYHQQALVALVRTEKSHQKTAYQIFNPRGSLAFLPLAEDNLCSIVWSTSEKQAQQLKTADEAEFNIALTAAFESRLGKVQVKSARYHFPLHMLHAKQYFGERWILLGDAAHTIHPLAGLGLNLGLADVKTFLSHMKTDNVYSKKSLGAYQRERKYAVWQTIALMEGLKTLFSNPSPPLIALRGLGLEICNRLIPLKRLFIEQAGGKKINC